MDANGAIAHRLLGAARGEARLHKLALVGTALTDAIQPLTEAKARVKQARAGGPTGIACGVSRGQRPFRSQPIKLLLIPFI